MKFGSEFGQQKLQMLREKKIQNDLTPSGHRETQIVTKLTESRSRVVSVNGETVATTWRKTNITGTRFYPAEKGKAIQLQA